MHKIVRAVALIIISGFSAAHAQERGYAGLAFGPVKAGVANSAGERIEHDDDAIAVKVYAGYVLNDYFALEGGYAGTTGKLRFDKERFGVAGDPRGEMSAVYAALRGNIRVSESVDLFAKLGVARNRFELAGAGARDVDISAVKPMAGAGAAWRISDRVALTAELEHYGKVRQGNRRFVQNRAQLGLRLGF